MGFFSRRKPARVQLEEQLRVLESCGITPAPGASPESLLVSFERKAFEEDPYRLALVVLGGEAVEEGQGGPSGYLSDCIWHFDTECIEDHGDYLRIAQRLKTLARGDLPLEEIEDHVDVEDGEAWLSFLLDGQRHRWDAEVNTDWVDPEILSRFARLLAERSRPRRFTYLDLEGQDCLIGCATPGELKALRSKTGLDLQWLE